MGTFSSHTPWGISRTFLKALFWTRFPESRSLIGRHNFRASRLSVSQSFTLGRGRLPQQHTPPHFRFVGGPPQRQLTLSSDRLPIPSAGSSPRCFASFPPRKAIGSRLLPSGLSPPLAPGPRALWWRHRPAAAPTTPGRLGGLPGLPAWPLRAAVMAAAVWGFFSVLLLLLSGDAQSSELPGATADGSGGTGVGTGDRFKIEGRAVVPGVKPQDWISAARVLVDGEEHVGFLKWASYGQRESGWRGSRKGIPSRRAKCQELTTSLSEGERVGVNSNLCRETLGSNPTLSPIFPITPFRVSQKWGWQVLAPGREHWDPLSSTSFLPFRGRPLLGPRDRWTPYFVLCWILSFASHLVSLESGHFLHSFQSFGSLMLCRKMLNKWEFSKPKGLLWWHRLGG